MTTPKRAVRKDRIPVSGAKDILTVKDKDPNYEYRWVLDRPGRILRFQDGGWEVVTDDLEVGQKSVDTPTKVGSAITKNMGGNLVGILMRISREWYNEDQIAKQDKVDSLEASMQEDIRQGRIPGTQERSYTPEGGGLKIERRLSCLSLN